MKAIQIHGYGDSSALSYDEVSRPEPEADDVRIRVHASGVNPVDWKIRAGYLASMLPLKFPAILGWDVSGVVDKLGSAVTGLSVGDAVYARPDIARAGTYAEYVVVRASEVAPKPKSVSHVEAAAVPLAALTAWQSLFDAANLQAGERVLIHAGAGGVGSFAIQFASVTGAEVIATASAANKDLVVSLGADQFVDYRSERFEEVVAPVDVVIDTIGGDTQARSLQLLKAGGRLVSVVQTPDADKLTAIGASGSLVMVQPSSSQLIKIANLIDTKQVRVLIDSVFALSDAKEAHTRSETGRAKGKIVLKVIPEST